MKTHPFIIAVSLLLGAVGSHAAAWNEPDAVLGRSWGATPAEVNVPNCTTDDCWTVARLGPFAAVGVSFYFHSGHGLNAVRVWGVSQHHYAAFRAAFDELYGQPTSMETEETTVGDVKVPSELVRWQGQRVTIVLRERCERANLSCASIRLNAPRDRAEQ